MNIPPRVLEKEIMSSKQDVIAYDELTKKYLNILHTGFVQSIVNLAPEEGRFLEVGCGSGWISIGVAANTRAVVTGIDLSENMLIRARSNAESEGVHNINFKKGDALRIPFDDNTFDCVYSHNMLHHLEKPEIMLKEIMRVSKDDGAVLVRDLKRLSRIETALHVGIFGFTYDSLMKKQYRDSIRASLTENEMIALAESVGLKKESFVRYFLTHMGLERPASARRKSKISVDVPLRQALAKSFYVSPK